MYKSLLLLLFLLITHEISAIFRSLHADESSKYKAIVEEVEITDMRDDVRSLVAKILLRESEKSTVCYILDSLYADNLITPLFSENIIFILKIADTDVFNDETDVKKLQVLNAMKDASCDFYTILITNGIQMINFLTFVDYNRLLNTHAKFIFLHDYRLFTPDLHFIWKRLINVIFIRKYDTKSHRRHWYELSTVPFPMPIQDVFVSRVVNFWITPDQFLKKKELFDENKSQQLDGNLLNAVVFPHSPAIMKLNENETTYTGLEIDLIRTMGEKMNFKVNFYESDDSDVEKWGKENEVGNYSGLLGEMNAGKADFALADLFYTMHHLNVMDLSLPYSFECLTFLTPEVLTDNSWKTLILPFALEMWIGILVSLICIIIIFFFFSNFYAFINSENIAKRDMFDDFAACIIYSYSMILVVSTPDLPKRWSVRVLTGWWWIYCVLIVTAYRASLTSILANPQPKLTIDTLEMLASSKLKCGAWGTQNRDFFINSDDDVARKVGDKMEEINEAEDGVGLTIHCNAKIFMRKLCNFIADKTS